ncbi:MAG TPA: hypothetical protein VFY27_13455, partial [Woeseiaceae bacterium]|nr:hypothetical protein [Woeseiaceae bacterium]
MTPWDKLATKFDRKRYALCRRGGKGRYGGSNAKQSEMTERALPPGLNGDIDVLAFAEAELAAGQP